MAAVALPHILVPMDSADERGGSHEGFIILQHADGGKQYLWVGMEAAGQARLRVGTDLTRLLRCSGGVAEGALHALAARLGRCGQAAQDHGNGAAYCDMFMHELSEITERLASNAFAQSSAGIDMGSSSSASWQLYPALAAQLDTVGWGCLEHMDAGCRQLVLVRHDVGGRRHRLRMRLPPGWPHAQGAVPSLSVCLPDGCPWPHLVQPHHGGQPPHQQHPQQQQQQQQQQQHPQQQQQAQVQALLLAEAGGDSSLPGLLGALGRVIDQAELQGLWEGLEQLDEQAWVVEPAPGVGGDARHELPPMRRIALGRHCFLILTLSPTHPHGPPASVAFSGPQAEVAALQSMYHTGMGEWDVTRSLCANLCSALGLDQLPTRQQQQQGAAGGIDEEDCTADCCLCYGYYLPVGGEAVGEAQAGVMSGDVGAHQQQQQAPQGDTPDIICPTPACSRPFHRRCLASWLATLPAGTASFGVMYGTCPYCSGPLSVAV